MLWLDVVAETLPGPTRLRVRGCSMLPTLRPGDEVLVHPVTAEALAPGDWVVLRGGFLHRYLGRRAGRIITKGDGHKALDPSWTPDAVLGRVVEAQRDGRCFYRRTPRQLRRERWLAAGHHALGDVWGVLRRVKASFIALFAAILAVSVVGAAVTLTAFYAEPGTDKIIVHWETANEVGYSGFYLYRSLNRVGSYTDISGFIAGEGGIEGALYDYKDANVTPGITYYYKLLDVPDNGARGDFTEPISAVISLNSTPTVTPTLTMTPEPTSTTPTMTPTATLTPTATVTGTPPPTATPNPNVRFWADKTELAAGDCTTLQWQTSHILAIYFDKVGVDGDGARTFCPCANETHILTVKYQDNSTEDFVITLSVTGTCTTQRPATPTATPTPRPGIPTLTPAPRRSPPGVLPTTTPWTPLPPVTVPASPTPDTPVSSPSPVLSRPLPPSPWPSPPRPEATLARVEGETRAVGVDQALSLWLIAVGGIVGLGFIGAGVLMWKRGA